MKLLELTLSTPAENLALDEALLEAAEAGQGPGELLRLWEPAAPCVVVGRSSRVAQEVNVTACRDAGIPVLRRCSGGAAIVTGPGCLMYSVVLSYQQRPDLRAIEAAHQTVLGVTARALNPLAPGVEMLGTSDLTRQQRKFSGNSLRCKRNHLLYHGTVLYRFPLELISQCLGTAPRQPEYRQQRAHDRFVDNLPADETAIRAALKHAWSASDPVAIWPQPLVAQLVADKYARDSWNLRL